MSDRPSEYFYQPCGDGQSSTADCSSATYEASSDFDPLSALKVPGHNIVLLVLAMNLMSYGTPVHDPWFRTDELFMYFNATNNDTVPMTTNGASMYNRTHYSRGLACAEKTELCKPRTDGSMHCIQLNSWGWPLYGTEDTVVNISQSLGLSQRQSSVAGRLQDASSVAEFALTVTHLGAER